MANKISNSFNSSSRINMQVTNGIILIKDLIKGYTNNSESEEGGVYSMDGKLNIRPRYQRAYVADTQKNWRENLINSIICGFPINRIYIGVDGEGENEKWEMLDGQQRSITICDFLTSHDFKIGLDDLKCVYYDTLPKETLEAIYNYPLDVTFCRGTESARIAWFKRINQPNSILTDQELRNATYLGVWLECAKKFFCATSSKSNNKLIKKDYEYCITPYTASPKIERSECLEIALDWISYAKYPELRDKKQKDERICRYMADHQYDENADELIAYYKEVIGWVKSTFLSYQKCQQKVEWGRLYAEYANCDAVKDITKLNQTIDKLMLDTEITANSAVYEWVLMGQPQARVGMLVLRAFQNREKDLQFKKQNGFDPITLQPLNKDTMKAHHIIEWSQGGKTDIDNLILINEDTHQKIHAGLFSPKEVRSKRDEWVDRCGN